MIQSLRRREFSPNVGHILAPASWWTFTEPVRALAEYWTLWCYIPSLMSAPRGDGHSVLVLPGFGTSDLMTMPLRRYLAYLGYDSAPWGLGLNTGFRTLGEDDALLHARIEGLFQTSGGKVTLIGWSLGGIMARRMARERPDLIRQVITLGSPFTGNPDAVVIGKLYELVSGEIGASEEAKRRIERDREPPTKVRATAIYSRRDGITAWQNCLEEDTPTTENIEVGVSHLGLPNNPHVFLAIADLLATPDT